MALPRLAWAVGELAVAPARGQDALGPEDHHEDEDQAEHHPLVLGGLELGGRLVRLQPKMVVPAFRSSLSQSDRP